jgi:transcriptional regulator with XRE-family HTH domain
MMDIENRASLPFTIDHLAVGLQKARVFRGINLKDCCSLLGISTNKLLNYEKGKYIPTLNELEALSYIYSVPLEALFFPENYPDLFKVPNADQLQQLLQIRQQIISTTLQIAFEKTGKSLKEISKNSGISLSKLKHFLSGEDGIPIGDLQRLSFTLDMDLDSLLDSESPIGIWQVLQKKKIAYAQLPENARDFLTTKENWPYMDAIEKLKLVDPGKLESIAESIRQLAGLSRTDQDTRE